MGDPNWVNRTVWTGDNLDIMRGMDSESVDLIYLDPPFNSKRNYAAPIGSKAAGAAFKDTWTLSDLDEAWQGIIAQTEPDLYQVIRSARLGHGKGMQSYLCMMAVRLIEMRRILRDTGSIYLHCDPTASHYLKTLMDVIYGAKNYRNEIVWCYTGPGSPKMRQFNRKHDTIFWYSKGESWAFNDKAVRIDHDQKTIGNYKEGLLGSGHADTPLKPGKVPETWWLEQKGNGFSITAKQKGQYVGFPTQKPYALLERIIKASSNEGDVVLDPFCGCATACVVAETHGRQWAGIDLSEKAVELVSHRLHNHHGLFGQVIHRTDIPKRRDTLGFKHTYKEMKHVLFGRQEGYCNLCGHDFPFNMFEIDHVIPKSKGGGDHIENRQLLCPPCNKLKGTGTMVAAIAKYKETYANSPFMKESHA